MDKAIKEFSLAKPSYALYMSHYTMLQKLVIACIIFGWLVFLLYFSTDFMLWVLLIKQLLYLCSLDMT